jgi:hypothetical protein
LTFHPVIISNVDRDCYFKCLPECDTVHNLNLAVMRKYEKVNIKKLNLISTNFPHMRFIETFKTDISQLIYDLGGILGLWLGMTLLSIAHLISFTQQNIWKFYFWIWIQNFGD